MTILTRMKTLKPPMGRRQAARLWRLQRQRRQLLKTTRLPSLHHQQRLLKHQQHLLKHQQRLLKHQQRLLKHQQRLLQQQLPRLKPVHLKAVSGSHPKACSLAFWG